MCVVVLLLCALLHVTGENVYNVLDFGAKGDGKTIDTAAIQKAFFAANASGSGDVLFPAPYVFLSFPFSFSGDNSRIVVEPGASISATNDYLHWPISGGQYVPFITASGLSNLSIVGGGTINGNGRLWWDLFTNNTLNHTRPPLLNYNNVENCLFEGVTFIDSPYHNLQVGCSYTEMRYINIFAPGEGHYNTDGVDVHASPFYIHDCNITVGDDNVAVHSNDTLIENCFFGSGHGVSVGNGWLKNITVRNSIFSNTTQATRIKTHMGDVGVVHNITFENLVMYDVGWPICIDMFYENLPQFADCFIGTSVGPTTQLITDILYQNITVSGVQEQAGIIACQPSSPCKNIQIVNFKVTDNPPPAWICMNAFGTNINVQPPSCLES